MLYKIMPTLILFWLSDFIFMFFMAFMFMTKKLSSEYMSIQFWLYNFDHSWFLQNLLAYAGAKLKRVVKDLQFILCHCDRKCSD